MLQGFKGVLKKGTFTDIFLLPFLLGKVVDTCKEEMGN